MTDTPRRQDVDEVIHRYGRAHAAHMAGEQRALMRSPMFDLHRRSSLGWTVLYDRAPELIRRWSAVTTGAQLGQRVRRLGSRPYTLQPMMVLCAYLAERQQRLMDAGLRWGAAYEEPDPEGLAAVTLWWRELQLFSRGDGSLFPEDRDGATALLTAKESAQLASRAEERSASSSQHVRRLAATVELYNLIVHGEQRDGTYGHGPYLLSDGTVLVVKEFNDLDNRQLSWTGDHSSLGIAALVIGSVHSSASGRGDLFGSFVVDAPDEQQQPRTVVLALDDQGRAHRLDDAEIADLTTRAAAAQQSLFVTVAGWPDVARVSYGAELFGNHAAAIENACLGAAADAALVGEFAAAGERLASALLHSEIPSIWAHFASHDGPLYWPMGTT